jgi:hypothetical protein
VPKASSTEYGVVKTDESCGELDHDEYYFEIEDEDKLLQFMEEFGIDIEDFDTEDAEEEGLIFAGLDFQLSVYPDGSTNLEFGPVFADEDEEDLETVDVISCDIEGLEEYLKTLI